jgi:hypothetical protein
MPIKINVGQVGVEYSMANIRFVIDSGIREVRRTGPNGHGFTVAAGPDHELIVGEILRPLPLRLLQTPANPNCWIFAWLFRLGPSPLGLSRAS